MSGFISPGESEIKIVVVGDGAVGKTCLLMRYKEADFTFDQYQYIPTIFENSFHSTVIEGKPCCAALWDTAGQEEFDRLRVLSYRDTDVVLLVYSVDNPTSLKNIRSKWYPEVMHHCGSIPTLLVGTKTDLRDDPDAVERRSKQGKRLVDLVEVQSLAEELGCIACIDCSALRGYNVDNVFQTALRHVLQKRGLIGGGDSTKCCTIM